MRQFLGKNKVKSKQKGGWCVAEVVECLPSKKEVLSSNPSTENKTNKNLKQVRHGGTCL
jgi:hypothetical protein